MPLLAIAQSSHASTSPVNSIRPLMRPSFVPSSNTWHANNPLPAILLSATQSRIERGTHGSLLRVHLLPRRRHRCASRGANVDGSDASYTWRRCTLATTSCVAAVAAISSSHAATNARLAAL